MYLKIIFRAFVYLNNLLHNQPLVHKVAVVNEKGNVRGYLRVRIEPIIYGWTFYFSSFFK